MSIAPGISNSEMYLISAYKPQLHACNAQYTCNISAISPGISNSEMYLISAYKPQLHACNAQYTCNISNIIQLTFLAYRNTDE